MATAACRWDLAETLGPKMQLFIVVGEEAQTSFRVDPWAGHRQLSSWVEMCTLFF